MRNSAFIHSKHMHNDILYLANEVQDYRLCRNVSLTERDPARISFSSQIPDKDDWDDIDHCAFALFDEHHVDDLRT